MVAASRSISRNCSFAFAHLFTTQSNHPPFCRSATLAPTRICLDVSRTGSQLVCLRWHCVREVSGENLDQGTGYHNRHFSPFPLTPTDKAKMHQVRTGGCFLRDQLQSIGSHVALIPHISGRSSIFNFAIFFCFITINELFVFWKLYKLLEIILFSICLFSMWSVSNKEKGDHFFPELRAYYWLINSPFFPNSFLISPNKCRENTSVRPRPLPANSLPINLSFFLSLRSVQSA
jgi:hypothetical protein